MKSKGFLWVVVLAAILAYAWPASDPLSGVQTVALASPGSSASGIEPDILEGVEFALGKHKITIVSDPNQADAVIEIVPQGGDFNFSFDQEGLRGQASIRCLVRKSGQESVMFLNLRVDENGFQAEFVGRKFWEVWK